MAVRANKFALGDLFENPAPTSTFCETPYIRLLHRAWQVVPVHRDGVKRAPTISARPARLQARVPGKELGLAPRVLGLAAHFVSLVMRCGVLLSAWLAPPLVIVVPAMELRQWLLLTAPSAL